KPPFVCITSEYPDPRAPHSSPGTCGRIVGAASRKVNDKPWTCGRRSVYVRAMRLLERLDVVARRRGMADTTIYTYSLWVKQFLTFSASQHRGWKRPEELFTS